MTVSLSNAPSSITVALLEDQRVLRESLQEFLEQRGFRVTLCCGDHRELFDGLLAARPEVVVVDLRQASGEASEADWRTVEHLRESAPHARVVVLSGARDVETMQRAQRTGASACLSKDTLSSADLAEVLRRVHGGEAVFPEPGPATPVSPRPLADPGVLGRLTPREVDVLRCISGGFDNPRIATILEVSERTVRAHVSNLYRKLAAENRTQLALMAREAGLRPKVV